MPSSSWIHDYHPSKIPLLEEEEQEVQNVWTDLNDIVNNRIPRLEEISKTLKELENFVAEEFIEKTTQTISDIGLRKGIITTFYNGNPVFDSEYYPEFIDSGNDNFSDTSICFILDRP